MDDSRRNISVFNNSGDPYRVDNAKIESLAATVCRHLGVADFELAISLVAPGEIRRLNKEHRDKDAETDVLSFPQAEFDIPLTTDSPHTATATGDGPPEVLGDVVVCLEVAARNAAGIGQGLDREVCFLMVHGILHLCGHDHHTPEEEALMVGEQKRLMELLSQPSPQWVSSLQSNAPEESPSR